MTAPPIPASAVHGFPSGWNLPPFSRLAGSVRSAMLAALLGVAAGPVSAGEKVLVVGDSLTKEYESEFKVLYPDNPAAWQARNWIELLNERRNDKFDLGSWGFYPDLRLTGHEYNWAKPGGTAREFRNFLRQTADAELEITSSSGGAVVWPFFPAWRNTFTTSTGQSQRVVIWFGGNDLALGNTDPVANPEVDGQPKQMDYESIYAGTFGEASDPDRMRSSIRSNLRSIIQWFRGRKDASGNYVTEPRYLGPIVLCAVPHVGCTPKIQTDAGTDPGRTAVLTQMLETLNSELRYMADVEYNMGFADVYAVTKAILNPGPYYIGGVEFYKQADADCRPRYLFSGDGFHPNTAAHAKIAQVITDAFRSEYPDLEFTLPRLTDREIITNVLGLTADLGYVEWMDAAGIPVNQRGPLGDPDADGIPNAMEYALAGRAANVVEIAEPFTAVREPGPFGSGEVLTITWLPRFEENAYCDLIPQVSEGGLQNWIAVEPWFVEKLPDGTRRVQVEIVENVARYFRLAAVRAF